MDDFLFPQDTDEGDNAFFKRQGGLTIRDYIAIQAMNGLINSTWTEKDVETLARLSYLTADAMLKERENHG